MAVNKVVYGTTTLVDLTDSTVTSNNLLANQVAYDKAGNRVVGELVTQSYFEGATPPPATLGKNGDLYLEV